ncbi:hypothetical protein [Leifsonia poae]|uniref:hypothetical protein n=1 Tax=Leifsonia poae TaxID=110933 RepID=UPI003D6764EB
MTDVEEDQRRAGESNAKPRKYRYPYGPLYMRLVTPGLAIVVGMFFVTTRVGSINKPGEESATVLVWIGVVLIVVGIAGIFLARWMAKRDL